MWFVVFWSDKATVPTIQKQSVDYFFVFYYFLSIYSNFFANFVGNFLYVDMIASVVNFLYLSVLIWYIFDVLSAKTKSFFDFFKAWR